MATAMPALDAGEDQEPVAAPETEQWEDTPQGSRRLLETQRKNIEAEIAHAKSILNQPAIDGEEGFYSAETLDRAVTFLKAHIEWVWQSRGTKAPVPTIGPGPRGSVDLYWEQPSWKLLVNVPADKEESSTFYGDDYGRQKTKGSLDPEKLSNSIVAWLMT